MVRLRTQLNTPHLPAPAQPSPALNQHMAAAGPSAARSDAAAAAAAATLSPTATPSVSLAPPHSPPAAPFTNNGVTTATKDASYGHNKHDGPGPAQLVSASARAGEGGGVTSAADEAAVLRWGHILLLRLKLGLFTVVLRYIPEVLHTIGKPMRLLANGCKTSDMNSTGCCPVAGTTFWRAS